MREETAYIRKESEWWVHGKMETQDKIERKIIRKIDAWSIAQINRN